MKKVSKFFLNFFIILAAAVAVFFVGWVQFYVKPGNTGILVSKTGGIYSKPVVQGTFCWRWERLLPTNAKIYMFSLSPYTAEKSYSGSLPSAALYAKMADPKPDFSYSAKVKMSVSITPEGILALVKKGKLTTQEDLNAYLDAKVDYACSKLVNTLIEEKSGIIPQSVLSADQIEKFQSRIQTSIPDITIQSVELTASRMPDIEVYNTAKKLFQDYETTLSSSMKAHAEQQAASILEEDRTMTQLEKFAKLLQQYPELQDISKSEDFTAILNTLRNQR